MITSRDLFAAFERLTQCTGWLLELAAQVKAQCKDTHEQQKMGGEQLCRGAEERMSVQVTGEKKTRRAPVPLSTLELQKKGTQLLRVSGDQIMKAAEGLYQQGLISYPRTETDQFDPAENVHVRSFMCDHTTLYHPVHILLQLGLGPLWGPSRFFWKINKASLSHMLLDQSGTCNVDLLGLCRVCVECYMKGTPTPTAHAGAGQDTQQR